MAGTLKKLGVRVLLVDPNRSEPDDAIRAQAAKLGLPAYRDTTLAAALVVKATPGFRILDKAGVLRYAGTLEAGDPNTPKFAPYVLNAVDDILAGRPVRVKNSTSAG